jgi:predicted GNAT family acetyltransferase
MTTCLGAWAEDVRTVYPRLPGVLGPSTVARAFCRAWKDASGQDSQIAAKLRVFCLETVCPVHTALGRMRRAVAEDRDLLLAWFAAFHEEALGPRHAEDAVREVEAFLSDTSWHLYLWEDGDCPVALAGARGSTAHSIRIGPVYTPPESRRRGYASGLVAALSQAMLDTGYQCCTLFTNLANPTSNHIYQEIGYRPVCDMDEYAFAEGNGEGQTPR